MNYDDLEALVAELVPYKGATGSEPDELLFHLLSIAANYTSYIQTEEFADALLRELTVIRDDYKENWEFVETEVTRTQIYKTLEPK